ncbi:MAG: hsp70 family protein [Rhodocyclales bacterium]|nr:hsp70 family protein [Rhodocyclales bacterium]
MSISACGIDFGTSNSTAAICSDGGGTPGTASNVSLLALEDGRTTLPSAVFFNLDEDSLAFGRAALHEYLEGYDGRLMRSLKSLLGSGLMDAGTEVGGRHLSFRNLIGCFIGEIRKRAQQQAGRTFDAVVVGRPVRFVDDDDIADKLAQDTLEQIVSGLGFREVSFQFEPIAAAHTYEQTIAREELVLVVDIGGGTSDFSLVRLSPERRRAADRSADLLGNSGVHIGGTDLDKQLSLSGVMPELGLGMSLKSGATFPNSAFFQLATWHTINLVYTRKAWRNFQDIAPNIADRRRFDRLLNLVQKQAGHRLAMRVEAAKIELSSTAVSTLMLDEAEADLRIALSRQDFEQAIAGEIARVCDAAQICLRQAGVATEAIDTLFFTGGSSAVPALREALAQRFPVARAVEGDLYGSVGCGLGVVAQQRYG